MIKNRNKEVKEIIIKGYRLSKIYNKRYLVWSIDSGGDISSCFGGGYWVNALPWINNDAWKNN
jgi:hypothetical protein